MWIISLEDSSQLLIAEDQFFSLSTIGWSADGTSWGWQSVEDAFGVGPDAWVELAVGDGFVLARVEVFETFAEEDFDSETGVTTSSGSSSAISAPRWFIARPAG